MPDSKSIEALEAEIAKSTRDAMQRPGMALFLDEEQIRKSPAMISKAFEVSRTRKAADDEDRNIQRLGDRVLTAANLYAATVEGIAKGAHKDPAAAMAWAMAHPEIGRPYTEAARAWFKKSGRLDDRVSKALDRAEAGHGLEFVPTEYSREYLDDYRLKTFVQQVHRRKTMNAGTTVIPFTGSFVASRLLSEQTGDNTHTESNFLTAIDHNTAQRSMTAVKIGFREVISEELIEDSVVDMVDWMGEEAQESQARGVEQAVISGDTTATHQDYDVHSATGNATDSRRAWIGWRKAAIALNEAKIDFGNGKPTRSLLINIKAEMGKWAKVPSDGFWCCSPMVHAYLLGMPERLFVPNENPDIVGEVGSLLGSRVFVSEHFPTNLHDTGVNTNGGDNDTSGLVFVNEKAWIWGDRRPFTWKLVYNEVTDQRVMIGTERLIYSYVQLYSTSGNTIVGYGYNIK